MNTNRVQSLLINHLQKHGMIKLLLPDGVVLEIGVNQLDGNGELRKIENYCWIMASREDKMAVLDSYNLGLRFKDDKDTIVLEDRMISQDGEQVRVLDVV